MATDAILGCETITFLRRISGFSLPKQLIPCPPFGKVTERSYICIMNCLKPIKRKNHRGEWMSVPCGHCKACLNSKAYRNTNLIKMEASKSDVVYFATLTYAPEYLPTVRFCPSLVKVPIVDHKTGEILGYDSREGYKLIMQTDRMKEFYKTDVLKEDYVESNAHYDYKTLLKPFKNNAFRLSRTDEFGVLYYRDVQLFIKRFRANLSYYLPEHLQNEIKSIKIFVVGEYGPRTFRPHYHIVFCVKGKFLKTSLLAKCFHKSWRYGRRDFQLSSCGKCARYVAGYVNSYTWCPSLLGDKSFRPFSRHSSHFGCSPDEEYYSKLVDLTYERTNNRSFVLDGRSKDCAAPLSIQSALFPKCYRFSDGDHACNLIRYQFLYYVEKEYRRIYQTTECPPISQLAIFYFVHKPVICGYSFFDLFPGCSLSKPWLNLAACALTALYTSKKFFKLCRKYDVPPSYYYNNVIVPYYKDKDYDMLRNQLLDMEETSQLIDDPKDLVYYYTNLDPDLNVEDSLPFLSFCESIEQDPNEVFLRYVNPHENQFVIWDYLQSSKIHTDNIKHKLLNEKNNVLYACQERIQGRYVSYEWS